MTTQKWARPATFTKIHSFVSVNNDSYQHRRSQDFSKGGSHCVKVRVLTRLSCRFQKKVLKKGLFNYGQDIIMAFAPAFVGCLVQKGLQKGGSRAPQDPTGYAPGYQSRL